jgi:hypothetical protein
MSGHHTVEPTAEEMAIAESKGYMHTDITDDVPKLVGGTIGMLVFFTICVPVTFLIYFGFQKISGHDIGHSAKVPIREELPGGPLVQSNATTKADMIELRAREEQKLKGYSSVKGQPNAVVIPVEKAIDEVSKSGLPNWSK